MSIIKILDENVANTIAAGEVVENKASLIKELVENSIDAGAKNIEIIIDTKKDFIKITDDGCGMDKQDLFLSIERHATSKINTKEDIFNIKTLGFRGEALASISSVSKLKIISKTKDDKIGNKITVFGGKLIDFGNIATKTGTIIQVDSLFYNTPARKKFLKKEQTEITNIKDIVLKLALSNYNIAFSLIIDGKSTIKTNATSFDNCVLELFGKNIFKNLTKFKYGYLGNENIYRGSKNSIYTFVNNRYCKSNVMERAVIDGYYTKLMTNKYPFAIIMYDIDTTQVDVNVHPSKKIIKFSDEKIVYNQIKEAIQDFHYENDRKNYTPNILKEKTEFNYQTNLTQQSLFNEKDIVNSKTEENKINIMGQVFDTYIAVKNIDSIDFYDQHALCERITYEKLKDKYYNQEMGQKHLLFPEMLDLNEMEKSVVLSNIQIFNDFKFDIQQMDNSIILRSVPDFELRNSNINIIKGIIDSLIENKTITDIREKVIISLACRTSIMAGQKLDYTTMNNLILEIHSINKFNCPHGRPIISKITKNMLDKMSKRKL